LVRALRRIKAESVEAQPDGSVQVRLGLQDVPEVGESAEDDPDGGALKTLLGLEQNEF
jgi:hypothetical protein